MIAIKGMDEMPSCCRHCPCSDDSQCNLITQYNDLKGRPDDCPLVEIVTCKDCVKGRRECSNSKKYCLYKGLLTEDDFYCADGERRE